jgi:hypothetical protein
MKVIIDLIEDIRESIGNEQSFRLSAMGLDENENSELVPSWQSNIGSFRVDDQARKMFLFLSKEEALDVGALLEALNALSNEAMMYELCVSYTKENQRVDTSLLGFGESLQDKRYHLFIAA